MKKMLIFIAIIFLTITCATIYLITSCATTKKTIFIKPIATKPFIITEKIYVYPSKIAHYYFTDKNGRHFEFYYKYDLCEIGDTIK